MFWEHQRGAIVASTNAWVAYRLTDKYNGQDVTITGFIRGLEEQEIINQVMSLLRGRKLRASAQNLDAHLNERLPEYVVIAAK